MTPLTVIGFAVNGRIRINDLLKEASEKYFHIGRVDIEKRRFHHRLQVVQKIEDTQRSNVVRSVSDVIRHGLDPDEVNAIYAFVKNAQLQRLQVGVASKPCEFSGGVQVLMIFQNFGTKSDIP